MGPSGGGCPTEWLGELPRWLAWGAVRAGVLAHAYWVGIGLSSMFSGRDAYMSVLALAYMSEPVVWAVARHALLAAPPLPPGCRPTHLTLLSLDLTLEVELAGVFLGFLAYHVAHYRQGARRVGSRASAAILGVAAPAAMVAAGVAGGVHPGGVYAAFWAVGVASGAARGVALYLLFAARLPVWEAALRGKPRFAVVRTAFVRELVGGSAESGDAASRSRSRRRRHERRGERAR